MTGPAGADRATRYVALQSFNPVVASLHAIRYRRLVHAIRDAGLAAFDILDIGAGTGRAFEVLNERFGVSYTGIDVSREFHAYAQSRYGHHSNFRMVCGSAADDGCIANLGPADVVIALEVLEHVPAHDAERVIKAVCDLRPKLFLCSMPIEIGPPIVLKNFGSWLCRYERHREYSWKETMWSALYRLDKLPPHDVNHKGFDWRLLSQTLGRHFRISATKMSPVGFLPSWMSLSVFFVCEPR